MDTPFPSPAPLYHKNVEWSLWRRTVSSGLYIRCSAPLAGRRFQRLARTTVKNGKKVRRIKNFLFGF